ncbi:sulfurtransferase TusA family protein [Maribrevibacterium harenarium]|uniref:Sulfurtransferase TusA family protein n=2 Tax=Maribrevibacterium harenarium TaxID=2589817 RepID=A0A501X4V4_9GAMM|nr:sulfurtransferase TusA family protein [Maribrevibacterium harenarium]
MVMLQTELEYDLLVDAREDRCPMPLLKAKLALAKCQPGQIICLMATDEGSLQDVPRYLDMVSHRLLEQAMVEDCCYFLIEKGVA